MTEPKPSLENMIHDLRVLHKASTPGLWGKGQTTHHTVSRREGKEPYRIAEFHHADDAAFCDAAHDYLPALLDALKAIPKSSFAHFVEEQEGNGPDAPSVGGKEGDAHAITLEALELVAMQPATRGVYLLDRQDMDFVKRAVKALKEQA